MARLRKQKNRVGSKRGEVLVISPLSFDLSWHPLSSSYRCKAKDLAMFYKATQIKTYGATIDLPFSAVRKHINRLIEHYGTERVERAIVWASMVSDHPFAFKFLEKIINDVFSHT